MSQRRYDYARGADRERQVCKLLGTEGWFATRVAGSRGAADVVALKPDNQLLVQVKSHKHSAFTDFGPAERAALSAMAQKAGAVAVLCWWPFDRRGPRWVPETLWPENERWNRYTETDTGYKTPCWLWLGQIKHNGYGGIPEGKLQRVAHKVYYERKYGPVPAGLDLDHLCRVRRCVRPDHLEPVDRSTNLRRGARGRLTDYALFSLAWLEATTTLTRRDMAAIHGVSGETVGRYLGKSGRGRTHERRLRERAEAAEHQWRGVA